MDIIYIKGKMQIFNKVNLLLDTGNSLKKKVLVGSFWLYMLQGLSTGLLLIQTIVLARILTPEHIGIIGIFLILSSGLESFTNTGFGKALVQRKEIDNEFLDTAWTVFVVRGAILFSLIFFGSTFIAELFNTPKAVPVIKILALSLLLRGFSNPGTVYFSRDLTFSKKFIWRSGDFLVNFVICVPLVFILRNEWAIVWGMLAGNVAGIILSFSLHSYRPKFRFKLEAFKELFKYGKWILLSTMVLFFSKQGDKILVTKLLGATSLGLYVIAWKFARIPELLTDPIPNVLFPVYCKLQDDIKVLKDKYVETLRVIGLFYMPVVGVLIVLARPFISIILGEKWMAAAFPLQILTFAVSINVIAYTSFSLFNAVGKTSFYLKYNCTSLIILSVSAYPLVRNYGVNGAALSYLAVSIAGFVLWKIEISKLIEFHIKDLSCIFLPLINTMLVAVLVFYLNQWLSIDNYGEFIGAICLSVLVYLFIGFSVERVTGLYFFHDVMIIWRTLKPVQNNK
jgi:lipopolysaccharide exporter